MPESAHPPGGGVVDCGRNSSTFSTLPMVQVLSRTGIH